MGPLGASRSPVVATALLVALSASVGATIGAASPAGSLGASGAAALALTLGGLLSGFLAGLLGIGGALVTIPLLYAALPHLGIAAGELPAVVVGTALLAMVPTTLVAAHRQRRHGALDGGWLRRLAPAMLAGAVAGAMLAARCNGPVLAWMFAAQGLFYGCRLLHGRGARGHPWVTRVTHWPRWLVVPPMAGFCACVGMGGGSMVTPYLLHRGLGLREAVATASALNLCIAVAGGLALVAVGAAAPAGGASPCYLASAVLGLAAVLTAPHGVAVAHRLPLPLLRGLVGTINIVASLALVAQTLPAR